MKFSNRHNIWWYQVALGVFCMSVAFAAYIATPTFLVLIFGGCLLGLGFWRVVEGIDMRIDHKVDSDI